MSYDIPPSGKSLRGENFQKSLPVASPHSREQVRAGKESAACGDSPPSSGALGNTHKVSRYAKGPPISGGWHAERDWGFFPVRIT